MRIVALDFETANAHNASACSLGIAIYEKGEILDSFEWYFRPHHLYNYFTNSHIHGIYPEDVQDEPEFVFFYDELAKILKDAVIVAHNAMFDITVLNAMCDVYGLAHFKNPFLDTVRLSRRVYPELRDHKLNTVSEYLGIDLSHHNAKSDAFACLCILLKSMERYEEYDLDRLMERLHMHLRINM